MNVVDPVYTQECLDGSADGLEQVLEDTPWDIVQIDEGLILAAVVFHGCL